jgi:glutamate dehydrogenase
VFAIATGILGLGERQRVKLFVRRDEFERYLSCLVFVPRDRFNTHNRERIQDIVRDAFGAERIDFELRLSDSVLVRIHYVLRTGAGELPAYDVASSRRASWRRRASGPTTCSSR